jgi:hypothetical protein
MPTRIVVDVPADFHEKLKISCAKNHTTIKDEITRLICASLDGVAVEDLDEKKVVDTLAEPIDHSVSHGWRHLKKEDLDAELKPILEITKESASGVKDFQQWREKFRDWQTSKFACLDAKLKEIDHKFVVTGKLIDSAMGALEHISSAKKCDDDRKGLALLRGESS